jgi:hypothetical protein
MITYSNETKVKDLPEPILTEQVSVLFKTAIFDFAIDMKDEAIVHSIKRLTYLISAKYKSLMLGEVKYVFDAMMNHIKGKLSVANIMQLFAKYMEEKIERQRQDMENKDVENQQNAVDLFKYPIGKAIIHKMNMYESGELTDENYFSVPLKRIAEDISSGKITVTIPKKKTQHIWDI